MKSFASLLVFILASAAGTAQITAEFTGLGDLPDGEKEASVVFDVSGDGKVAVGQGQSDNGAEAFRWEDGVMVGLGDLPGGFFASVAFGVSDNGDVVAGFGMSGNGHEAFRWQDGVMEGLGDLPGGQFESIAWSVSGDGDVVVGDGDMASVTTAFRWENGIMEALPPLMAGESSNAVAISADGSIVVGNSGGEAVRWVDGDVEGLGFPPGGDLTNTWDASADASVVVGRVFVSNPDGTEAFIWREGVGMDYIPDLPGGSPYREALAVSGHGLVVGGTADGGNGFEAFIWTEETGTRSFKQVLEEEHGLDLTGWKLSYVSAISFDGRVLVGDGFNPAGEREAWRAELPPWPVANTPADPQSSEWSVSVYPNPLRERATVRVTLPAAGHARIDVLDVLGRVVVVLHDGTLAIGTHSFSLGTARFPAGVYVVRADFGKAGAASRTVTVLR